MDTVGVQYTIGVGAKRSTHTVYLAHMGAGDHYLKCKKVKPHAVGDAVCSRCWCKKVNSHSVLSKHGCWGPLPLVQKGQTLPSEDAVHSRCWCKKVKPEDAVDTVCSTQWNSGIWWWGHCLWYKKVKPVDTVHSRIVVYDGGDIVFGAKRSN